MTRKEFNQLLSDKYGRTPAQWKMYVGEDGFAGHLYHRSQLYDIAELGVAYNIVPYYDYTGNNMRTSVGIYDLVIKPIT